MKRHLNIAILQNNKRRLKRSAGNICLQLRQMDKRVSRKGTIISIIIGVIGCLLLGIGMCCTMEWAGRWFVPGIIIGVIGIVMIALAYPLYERITKKERKKIAPLILKLADELKSKE